MEGEEENEGWGGGNETNVEYTRVKTDEYLSLFLSGKRHHVSRASLGAQAGISHCSQTGKNLERVPLPDGRMARGGGGEISNLDQSYRDVLLCSEVLSPPKPLYLSTLTFMSELCPDYETNEAASISAESHMHVCIIVSST